MLIGNMFMFTCNTMLVVQILCPRSQCPNLMWPHVCLVGQLVAAMMKLSPKGKSKSLWHLVTASAGQASALLHTEMSIEETDCGKDCRVERRGWTIIHPRTKPFRFLSVSAMINIKELHFLQQKHSIYRGVPSWDWCRLVIGWNEDDCAGAVFCVPSLIVYQNKEMFIKQFACCLVIFFIDSIY